MKILGAKDVASILRGLTHQQTIQLRDTLATSLAGYSDQQQRSRIVQPQRAVLTTGPKTTTLIMPVSDSTATSVKVITLVPGNPIVGALTVFASDGQLLGVLNAAEVTSFRTALTSMTMLTRTAWAVAAAAEKGSHVVVFGAGGQAEWHVRLVLQLAPVKRVTLVNRSSKRIRVLEESFLRELGTAHPNVLFETLVKEDNDSYQNDLQKVLRSSDIIFGTTPSTEPLFPASYLGIGIGAGGFKSRFISLIGSYKPNMHEIDTETLLSATGGKVWVDTKEGCLEEAGELISAGLTADDLREVGELYQNSPVDVVVDERSNLIFKCVGMGLMDLVIGKALLDVAQESSRGVEFDEF